MLKRYLRKFDFFVHSYNFESEGSSRHKSVEGAFFSLIGLAAVLAVSFIFGQDLYLRKNPNVSLSTERVDDSTIDFKEFPIFFTFVDAYARDVTYANDIFDFEITNFVIDHKNNVTVKVNYSMDNCKNQLEHFQQSSNQFKEIVNTSPYNLYCLNFNLNGNELKVRNDFGTADSNVIRIRLLP